MADGDFEKKIDAVATEVMAVKIQLTELNGKVDNLTNVISGRSESINDRFEFIARTMEQGFSAVNERVNYEVRRSDEAASALRLEINDLRDKELAPLKAEVDTSKQFRNKVIGIALGVGAASGGIVGLIAQSLNKP